MMSSKWISLGIGLGLLLLLVAFALLVSRRSAPLVIAPVAAPVISSTVGMTAGAVVAPSHVISTAQVITHSDWLTFTDPEAGYSIQYPANFVVHSGKNKGDKYNITIVTFVLPNVNMYQALSIQVEPNPQKSSVDTIIEQIYQRLNKKTLELKASDTLEQMSISGMTAYKTEVLPGSTDFHVLLPYGNRVYHFALVHGLGPIESAPEAKMIFFQILETFKIMNS